MALERNKHPLQYAKAELLTAGSLVAPHVQWLASRIVGKESSQLIQWTHNRHQDVDEIGDRDAWHEFPGQILSGRVPKKYQHIAILSASKFTVDAQLREHGGQQAVAYADKQQIMVGTAREGTLFDEDPQNNHNYAIGMGIGKGTLLAQMGHLGVNGMFTPLMTKFQDCPVVERQDCPIRIA